jgi:signal transduction histidine kinase
MKKNIKLTPQQEIEYQHKMLDTHVFFRRTGVAIAFLAYAFFVLSDKYVVPSSAENLLLYRFIVICPILLIYVVFSYSKSYRHAKQPVVVVQSVILGYLHLGLMSLLIPTDAGFSSYYGGLILIICGLGAFAGLSAKSCLVACTSIVLGYQFIAIFWQGMLDSAATQGVLIINNLFLVTAVAFSILVSHLLETYRRSEFIHELTLNDTLCKLRESEAKLKMANADQLHWSKMLTRFLRHELGNQLNGVSTSLQLIERFETSQKIEKYVERGNKSLQQLKSLLVRASDATSIDEVLAVTQKSTIDIPELLQDLVNEYNYQFPQKINFKIQSALTLEGSSLLISQLFRNVIDNAVRHSDKSSQVLITLSESKEIIIENAGDPLPENIESLFKLGNSIETGAGHFGMGLFIAKKVVEAHQGNISAETQSNNQGARFIIKLNSLKDL